VYINKKKTGKSGFKTGMLSVSKVGNWVAGNGMTAKKQLFKEPK